MHTPDSQIIVHRFLDALQRLKDEKVIRGQKTFTDRYGINRRNLYLLAADSSRNLFQPAWLSYLVRDYHISPGWLLSGDGDFFAGGWDASSVAAANEKPANILQR